MDFPMKGSTKRHLVARCFRAVADSGIVDEKCFEQFGVPLHSWGRETGQKDLPVLSDKPASEADPGLWFNQVNNHPKKVMDFGVLVSNGGKCSIIFNERPLDKGVIP